MYPYFRNIIRLGLLIITITVLFYARKKAWEYGQYQNQKRHLADCFGGDFSPEERQRKMKTATADQRWEIWNFVRNGS
jgi:hypothetical protein